MLKGTLNTQAFELHPMTAHLIGDAPRVTQVRLMGEPRDMLDLTFFKNRWPAIASMLLGVPEEDIPKLGLSIWPFDWKTAGIGCVGWIA